MTGDTPDHLCIVVPRVIKEKIWYGVYVNLPNFIPKTEEEESTSNLEFVDVKLIKKVTTKKVNGVHEWTTSFIRYMWVYLQKHTTKSLVLLQYIDKLFQG
jgi:hypothetical protein